MDFTSEQQRVAENILAIARKYRSLTGVPPLVVLAVTKQESDWNEGAVGDAAIGGSYGPFQIYLQAHPGITPYVATSPWYDYGFAEMWQRWRGAWASAGLQWDDSKPDPAIVAAFAPSAQGSVAWTTDLAQTRLQEAQAMLQSLGETA